MVKQINRNAIRLLSVMLGVLALANTRCFASGPDFKNATVGLTVQYYVSIQVQTSTNFTQSSGTANTSSGSVKASVSAQASIPANSISWNHPTNNSTITTLIAYKSNAAFDLTLGAVTLRDPSLATFSPQATIVGGGSNLAQGSSTVTYQLKALASQNNATYTNPSPVTITILPH